MHWPEWVQEAWATVARVEDPSFSTRCMCGDCWDKHVAERNRHIPSDMSARSAKFLADNPRRAKMMAEGLSGSSLNIGHRYWVSGETLTMADKSLRLGDIS